jgi:L-alanine-DL-glutamate epimerase-like enolase superfamily enzyme
MLEIPDKPGLGITINLDAVQHYTGVTFDAS